MPRGRGRARRGLIIAPAPAFLSGITHTINDDGEAIIQYGGNGAGAAAAQPAGHGFEDDEIGPGFIWNTDLDVEVVQAADRYSGIEDAFKIIYTHSDHREVHFSMAKFKNDGSLDAPTVVGVRDVQFQEGKALRVFCNGEICSNENYKYNHIFSSRDFPGFLSGECGSSDHCLCGKILLHLHNGQAGLRAIMVSEVSGNIHRIAYKNHGSRTRMAFKGYTLRMQGDAFSYRIVKERPNGYFCLSCRSSICLHVKTINGDNNQNDPAEREWTFPLHSDSIFPLTNFFSNAGHMSARAFNKSLEKAMDVESGIFKVKGLSTHPIQPDLSDPDLLTLYRGNRNYKWMHCLPFGGSLWKM